MSSVLESGRHHLAAALKGEAMALRALFEARVACWGKPCAHEEAMTVGLFSDFEQHLPPSVAFSLVPEAVQLAKHAQDEFERFDCALELLASLVAASATTEIPSALQASFPALERKATAFGGRPLQCAALISKHYRHAFQNSTSRPGSPNTTYDLP